MSNIKPLILVNKTKSPLIFETLKKVKDHRTVLVTDETGKQVPAIQEYEYYSPRGGRTIEVPATLPQAGVTGYVVLTKTTWTELTSSGAGYAEFEERYLGRGGSLDLLDDPADTAAFIKEHDIIVDKVVIR